MSYGGRYYEWLAYDAVLPTAEEQEKEEGYIAEVQSKFKTTSAQSLNCSASTATNNVIESAANREAISHITES